MDKPSLKSVKDQGILAYISHLEAITTNSRFNTFIALRRQVDSFNQQLTPGHKIRRPHPDPDMAANGETVEVEVGFIDLFADKDSKEFDRAWKYMMEAHIIEDNLETLFKKMTPAEQENATKMVEGASAEKYIFPGEKNHK